MINLASDFAALNELEKSTELGREALNNGRQALGERHPTVLAAAFNLGLDLAAAGHTDEADAYRDPILIKYCQVLGKTHPETQAVISGNRVDCDIDSMLM